MTYGLFVFVAIRLLCQFLHVDWLSFLVAPLLGILAYVKYGAVKRNGLHVILICLLLFSIRFIIMLIYMGEFILMNNLPDSASVAINSDFMVFFYSLLSLPFAYFFSQGFLISKLLGSRSN
jgi:hypothetical protein